MRINKNSWHYRLNKYTWGEPPEHFCPYLRVLVFSITIGGLLQLIYSKWNIKTPDYGIGRGFNRLIKFTNTHNIPLMEIVYGVIGIRGITFVLEGQYEIGIFNIAMAGTMYFILKYGIKLGEKAELKSSTFRKFAENSIAYQALKSNHNKVCPHLDFYDKELEEFNEKLRNTKLTEMHVQKIDQRYTKCFYCDEVFPRTQDGISKRANHELVKHMGLDLKNNFKTSKNKELVKDVNDE